MDAQERWYLENITIKDQIVADVGANVGRLSQFFFDHGSPKTRVISIEPVPANIAAIEKRIRKARAAKRWTLKKCAVSDRDGHLEMRLLEASWGDNAVVANNSDPEKTTTIHVACRRLSSLVPDATVVKLDIEGHEYAVLEGAIDELEKAHTWALELHGVDGHPLETTLQRFRDRGFSLVGAGRRRGEPEGPWVNFELPPSFGWDDIPGTPSIRDGVPGMFKMIHVLARR